MSNPLYAIDASRRAWELSDFYAQGPQMVQEIVDPALHLLGVDPSGLRVLEIGCGMGRLFEGLSHRFAEVWGIDISKEMIRQGQQSCPVDATWLVGDGLTLGGVEDQSVDHVLSFEVFEHVQDPSIIRKYFEEIARVLRGGGTFQAQLRRASDTPRQAVVRALPRPLRLAAGSILQRTGVLAVKGDIDTWLGCLFPPSEASSMLEDLGFQQWHVLAKDFGDIPERNPHYWVLGRKPHMSERPAEPDAQGNG